MFDCAFNARRNNHFDDLYVQRNSQSPWQHTSNDYYCNSLSRWEPDGEYLITGRYEDEAGNADGFLSFLSDGHWGIARVFGESEYDEFIEILSMSLVNLRDPSPTGKAILIQMVHQTSGFCAMIIGLHLIPSGHITTADYPTKMELNLSNPPTTVL